MKKVFTLLKHPLLSGSLIVVLGSNFVSFLNYLYYLIMGRMLQPANFGELVAIISLLGLLSAIPASLSLVVIKHISAVKNEKDAAPLISWFKTKIFISSLIFSFVILAVSPLISSFLNIKQPLYIMIVAISFLFSLQSLLNRSILQGLLKFKEMVISNFLEGGSKLLLSIILVFLGFQILGAMAGLLISIALGWYITNLYLKQHNRQIIPKINLRGILLFTFPVLIQSVSITSFYSADVILVKHFFSPYEAGIYAALSTLGKIIFFAAGPISIVMFPLISRRKARGEDYKRIFKVSFLATALVALGILLFYWQFPRFAIILLFGGTKYLEAASLLVWFGIFMTLFTLSSLLVNFGLSLGRTFVVAFPLIASLTQIILITFFHQTLFMVVSISIFSAALLLLSLLIYSIYEK